jgi:hypothetical protein
LSRQVIDTFTALERQAADLWWTQEDRSVWRDELLRAKNNEALFSLKDFFGKELSIFPISMWDEDLSRCFSSHLEDSRAVRFQKILTAFPSAEQLPFLSAIALRPAFWLDDDWHSTEELLRSALQKAQWQKAPVLRFGFFTQQADILMSADLGFAGIFIYADHLDVFELQLLVELARDCRLVPVVMAADFEQLEVSLQTDAAHLALCCLRGSDFESALRFVQEAVPRIPHNCTKLLVSGAITESEAIYFHRLGVQGVFSFV